MRDGRGGAGWRHRVRIGLLALACGTARATETAQVTGSAGAARDPGQFVVAAQADDRSEGDGGGGGQVLWLRPLRSRGTLALGASTFTLAGTDWSFATAGYSSRMTRRLTFDVELSAGRGRTGGAGFAYNLTKGLMSCELYPKRLYGEWGLQYLDIADKRGGVASAGLTVIAAHGIDGGFVYYRDVHADFESETESFRVGLTRRGVRVFGGVSRGSFTPEITSLVGPVDGSRSTELYLGSDIPLRDQKWTVLARRLDVGDTVVRTLVLVWKVPLRSRSRQDAP